MPASNISLILIGDPTVLIEIGGLRPLIDLAFDLRAPLLPTVGIEPYSGDVVDFLPGKVLRLER